MHQVWLAMAVYAIIKDASLHISGRHLLFASAQVLNGYPCLGIHERESEHAAQLKSLVKLSKA